MYIPRRCRGSSAVQPEFKLSDLRKLKYGIMVGTRHVSRDFYFLIFLAWYI